MAIKIQTVFLLGLALVSKPGFSEARAQLDIRTLKEARSELVVTDYTAEDRQLMADQAYLFIKNMYVHRELKINDFGVSADATSRLADVQKKAAEMTNEEFHKTMQKIFLDLRDHHTNYHAPLPLACSYVLAPLVLKDIEDQGERKIVVDRISNIFNGIPGDHTAAKIADEVTAINGIPMAEYLEKVKAESASANPDSMIAFGLMNVAIRSLADLPVPEEDTITYSLKGKDGTYEIESPLYALVNEPQCAAAMSQTDEARLASRVRHEMENPRNRVWRRLALPEKQALYGDDPLNDIARIRDIKTPNGKVTYMELFTFYPDDPNFSIEGLIHRMIEVLKIRQETSTGLIIDLRGNGGGAVKLAEEMVQIFTPATVEPMPVRMLPNELNLNMFLKSNGGVENGWSSDVKTAIENQSMYTKPRVLTTVHEANRFGQVWFKPVVVLTDATCYSACDLFAAGMQDQAQVKIVGVHDTTGAGGANVMEYDSFRAVFGDELSNNPFKKLPANQSMRVSWRQSLRTGKNAGKLIENYGVESDLVIRESKDDVGEHNSRKLLATVTNLISEMSPNFKSSIKLASKVRMENGSSALWEEDVKGIDTLDIVLDDKVLKTLEVSPEGERVAISLPDVTGNWNFKRFELIGRSKSETSFRVVRKIYWRGDDIQLTRKGIEEDLESEPKYIRSFASEGSDSDVWQVADGKLRVGQGPNYSPSIVTEAFIPLDVSKVSGNVTLLIDFKLQSEEGMDTFSILARDTDTGVETYLYTLDGTLDTRRAVPITIPNLGEKVEIVLEFESDENWNMTGPEIRKISIQGKSPSRFGSFLSGLFGPAR